MTVPAPRGLGVYQGRLYMRTGNDVATLNTADGTLTRIITGVNAGRSLAFAPNGRLYLGDDVTHQVRGYELQNGAWREVDTIGTPGGRQLGRYDRNAIATAYGMTVDTQGRVWLAEADFFPKRVSVFNADGQFVTEFLGPPLYGGGGSIDPRDATRMFYNGVEFTVDWAKHTASPYAVVTRIPEPYAKLGIPLDNRGIDGRIWYLQDRRYYVTGHQYAVSPGLLISTLDAQERIKPATMIYTSKAPGVEIRVWVDRNGDGQVQDAEISAPVQPKMPDGRPFWAVYYTLADNGDVYIDGTGTLFRLPVQGWTAQGAPEYDPSKLVRVRSATGAYVSTVLPDGHGVALGTWLNGYWLDGTHTWRYPVVSCGVGQGGTPGAGRIVASLNIQGTANAGPVAGETFVINGNLGQRFLMTSDGLYIASLFRQIGSDEEKPKPATWHGGELLDETSVGPESFGGYYGKTSDGKIYLISGREDCKVTEVTGLTSIKRFTQPLTIAPDRALALSRALTARGEAEVRLLHVAEQRTAPLLYLGVNGPQNTTAWRAWTGEDGKGGFGWLPLSLGALPGKAHLAYDDTYLYFAGTMQTDKLGRSVNARTDTTRLAATGGSWEIRLDTGVEQVRVVMAPGPKTYRLPEQLTSEGVVNTTVIYRTQGKATKEAIAEKADVRFASPDGRDNTSYQSVATYLGCITNYFEGQAWPHDASYFTLDARIPLAALGLTLKPGMTINGDVAVSLADDVGTGVATRLCWASPVGGVLDNAALAERVDPALLGHLVTTTSVQGKTVLASRVMQPLRVDGKLDDWNGMPFAPLLDAKLGELALATDGQQLFVAARVHTNAPLRNNGTDWTQLFKTGTAVDVQFETTTRQRLLFAPKDGGVLAILSREAPGTPQAPAGAFQENVSYVSPMGQFTMGLVLKLDNPQVVFTPTPDGFTMEAAVPLALLGLKPGMTVTGDVGVLISDADGKATARRVYWANADTSIVADLPTEARFAPQNWGVLKIAP